MKDNKGHFRQRTEMTIIGAAKDEPDTAELIDAIKSREREDNLDQDEEDNDEGLGDVDLDDQGAVVSDDD